MLAGLLAACKLETLTFSVDAIQGEPHLAVERCNMLLATWLQGHQAGTQAVVGLSQLGILTCQLRVARYSPWDELPRNLTCFLPGRDFSERRSER